MKTKLIILIIAVAVGYGTAFWWWDEERGEAKKTAETRLENAQREVLSLIDGDAHFALTSKGKIPRDEYERMLAPLVAFHMARPDIAHVYTAITVGGEPYSILDTAQAAATSQEHTHKYPGKGVEKIEQPDEGIREALLRGKPARCAELPNRNTYGADLALYTPILKKDGTLAGVLAMTINKDVVEEANQAADWELAKNLAGLTALLLIGVGASVGKNNGEIKEREARERTEEQFKTMTERLPGGVFIFSSKGKSKTEKGELLFASAGIADLTGKTPEQAAAAWKDLLQIMPEANRAANQEKLARAKRETSLWECEYEFREKWVLASVSPRKQEDRTVWFGTLTDITTKKNESKKLEETNEILKRINEAPNAKETLQAIAQFGGEEKACVIHLVGEGKIRGVAGAGIPEEAAAALAKPRTLRKSEGAAAVSGVQTGTLWIEAIQDSAFYADAEDLRDALLAAGFTKSKTIPLRNEERMLGAIEFLSDSLKEEAEPNAREKQAAHLTQTAMERLEAIRVLEENEKRYRTLFESSPVGICEIGEEGELVFANKTFELETDEDDLTRIGACESNRLEMRKPKKTLLAEIRSLEKASGKTHRIIFVYDISDQKRREESALLLKGAAEAANKAKSEFLAVMSHEIRTPLNAVIGFAEMLEGMFLADPVGRYVKLIRQAGLRLLATINDILDLSKIEAGKIEIETRTINPAEMLEGIVGLYAGRAKEKGIKLTLECGELPFVKGDETRLGQIATNLIGNAIKFTERGGVTVRADYKEGTLVIAVKDSGIGISPENQKRLFQPFSQADSSTTRRFGGTGLGLAISKKLAELMGGKIELWSKPGEGAEFTVTVPAGETAADTGAERKRVEAEETADALPLNILIAEDDEINRMVIGELLKGFGHEAEFANDGVEAVARAKELIGWADVILMDMRMPEKDGLEATKEIRESGQTEIPIIALTANAMEEDRERCMAAGMNNYLSKPINVKALKAALAACQSKKRKAVMAEMPTPAKETPKKEKKTPEPAPAQETKAEKKKVIPGEIPVNEVAGDAVANPAPPPVENLPAEVQEEEETQVPEAPEAEVPTVEAAESLTPATPGEPSDAWGYNLEPMIAEGEAPLLDMETLNACLEYLPTATAEAILERMKKSCREGSEKIADKMIAGSIKAGIAHKMHGSVGTLGCTALSDVTKEIELHYASSDAEHPKAATLPGLVEKSIEALEKELERLKGDPDE